MLQTVCNNGQTVKPEDAHVKMSGFHLLLGYFINALLIP